MIGPINKKTRKVNHKQMRTYDFMVLKMTFEKVSGPPLRLLFIGTWE